MGLQGLTSLIMQSNQKEQAMTKKLRMMLTLLLVASGAYLVPVAVANATTAGGCTFTYGGSSADKRSWVDVTQCSQYLAGVKPLMTYNSSYQKSGPAACPYGSVGHVKSYTPKLTSGQTYTMAGYATGQGAGYC
jgi:hypothetical protein